jgi:hypothetical protein
MCHFLGSLGIDLWGYVDGFDFRSFVILIVNAATYNEVFPTHIADLFSASLPFPALKLLMQRVAPHIASTVDKYDDSSIVFNDVYDFLADISLKVWKKLGSRPILVSMIPDLRSWCSEGVEGTTSVSLSLFSPLLYTDSCFGDF